MIIPKPALERIGAQQGDALDVQVENDRLVVTRVGRRDPREGWAEEAKALAAAGEDKLVWPEFGNEFDEENWRW